MDKFRYLVESTSPERAVKVLSESNSSIAKLADMDLESPAAIKIIMDLRRSFWTYDDIKTAILKYNMKKAKDAEERKAAKDRANSYDAAVASSKVRSSWNKAKYKKLIKDFASNGGARNAYDMAQNAALEPGLIAFVTKEIRSWGGDETPLERIQWDIEAYA